MKTEEIFNQWKDAKRFSGVFSVTGGDGVLFEKSLGLRNISEGLINNRETAFGIASGTKLMTGLTICKLIDQRKLSLEDRLWDILPYDLGQIDKRVTVFHLLTHTSGIGDYIDEEAPDSVGQMQLLYMKYPVYLWDRLSYYLQMITPLQKKFEPGERFGYSNAGYVLLGLVAEAVSGMTYQQSVENEIIHPLNLKHTGFYRTDELPGNTALGYLGGDNGSLQRANLFSLPVMGGSDGGLYTCADDLNSLWRALFGGRILSESMRSAFLKPQVSRGSGKSYGLGVYRRDLGDNAAFYAVGSDFGVDFFTAFFLGQNLTVSALGNTEIDTYPLLEALLSSLLDS